MPSVQELLLWLLARLERAPPALDIINAPTSIASVGPFIAPAELAMIHVGASSIPTDLPMTSMILP